MLERQAFNVLMPIAGTLEQSPFGPIMETLVWGLRDSGHEASCSFGAWRDDARQIVLCPHLLDAGARRKLPADAILYNLEQISPASPMSPNRLWEMRHWPVWDFSARNAQVWRSLGIAPTLVPVGWYPGLDRVRSDVVQNIDVLFYGALNARREAALNRVSRLGLKVAVCDRVFGGELNAVIARSKVVLNVHFYPAKLLETVRISYLLANGRAVLAERSPLTEVPAAYESAVCWASYEELAETCRQLVDDSERRASLGAAGRAAMRRLPITPIIAGGLSGAASDAARAAT